MIGGEGTILEMARRMLVWDDELYDGRIVNDASGSAVSPSPPSLLSLPPEKLSAIPPPTIQSSSTSLPRWRPSSVQQQTISNVNPSFRTESPVMTNAGYASIMRRNSRKKNKPSMWKHTLRLYNRMTELEREHVVPGVGYTGTLSSSTSDDQTNIDSNNIGTRRMVRIKRNTYHHQAALVAASKLGAWQEAVSIFRGVESMVSNTTTSSAEEDGSLRKVTNRVTDNMILSVISACVKASKVKRTLSVAPTIESKNPGTESNATNTSPSRPMIRLLTIDERRKPLDTAKSIILTMEPKHDIPLVSRHINPLASAYNNLGLRAEASKLINDHLNDRSPPPPPAKVIRKNNQYWKAKKKQDTQDPGFELAFSDDELEDDEDGYEQQQLNIHQLKSKDRASYSLLVQSKASDGDWVGAVQELQKMNDAGLQPNSRNLNSWNELMERGCRPTGGNESSDYIHRGRQRRRGMKKKRDRIWLDRY